MSVNNVAILVDDLTLGSPAQQIVDRFLRGYSRDGIFERPPFKSVSVVTANPDGRIEQHRRRDFPKAFEKSRAEAIATAAAILAIQKDGISELIETAPKGAAIFVYGAIGNSKSIAEAVIEKAEQRGVILCAGTVASVLQQLPPMQIPTGRGIGAQVREALVVTHGPTPEAETVAFDALCSVLEEHGGVPEIRTARNLHGNAVWEAANRDWSWRMLASALSRTDKAQGNTALDGRTEDIVGLGLTQKMATNPRAVIVEHSGMRSAILVLDGVVADLLVAVRAGRRLLPGAIYSTRLFQSPIPQQEEFSRLVAAIVIFFHTGLAPWGRDRAIVAADFSERLGK